MAFRLTSKSATSLLRRAQAFSSNHAHARIMAPGVVSAKSRVMMAARHLSSDQSAEKAQEKNKEQLVTSTFLNPALPNITLTRPAALNSLNEDMCHSLDSLISTYSTSPSVQAIILQGEGRAFCAGGDVVSLSKALANDPPDQKYCYDFFKTEYEVDVKFAKLEKPVVALWDGIVMGGGVGISIHAPFRIATEKTLFAMPETTIGLFPDVGASFFLSRMDGGLGLYLGLTSSRLSGYAAYQAGVASHFITSSRIPALVEAFAAIPESGWPKDPQETLLFIDSIIRSIETPPTPSDVGKYDLVGQKRELLDKIFSVKKDRKLKDILGDLGKVEGELQTWAKEIQKTIEGRSPTSCEIAIEQYRRAKSLDIDQVFNMDWRLACACCTPSLHTDFRDGVHSLLIQKSKTPPAWQAPPNDLKSYFSFPVTTELELPTSPTFKSYPHVEVPLSLPSEEYISKVVKGETKNSGSYALTEDEIVKKVVSEWKGKIGVEEKVREVVARKTKLAEENTRMWIH